MEDDPATLPDDPAVVDHPRVGGPAALVSDGGGRGRPARDAATEQQREHEARVHQAGDEPDAGEPPGRREWLLAGTVAPSGELERAERPGYEPQELRLAGRVACRGGERDEVQAARRDDDAGVTERRPLEQVALPDVGGRGHRVEQLAPRELQDRLVPLEQLEVGRVAHPPTLNTARRSRWLR